MDFLTPAARSVRIAAIKGRNNKSTEQALASLLRSHHITGWRRQLPVHDRPDFAFPQQRGAIFIDGCFWHGCPRHGTQPKSNAAFLRKKLATNKARDRRVDRELCALGWRVVRVWQHELKKRDEPKLVRRLNRVLGRSA